MAIVFMILIVIMEMTDLRGWNKVLGDPKFIIRVRADDGIETADAYKLLCRLTLY